MRKMKKLILCGCLLLPALAVEAQDMHFSQYDETPSMVNPALTGSAYVMRAAAIYKRQWESVTVPYKTLGASFDMKFKASNWEKQDPFKTRTFKKSFSRMAGGLSFFNDQAGDGDMGINQVNLSVASFIKTGKLSTLSVGLQASVVQKSVNYAAFIFSNQYNGTSYDPTIPSNELYGSQSFVYPDFAAGVYWKHVKEEESLGENNFFRADVGAAVFHVAAPKQKFLLSTDERLYRRLVLHSKFLIGIPNSNVGIAPSIMCNFQGPSKEFIFGLMGKYYLKEDSRYTGYVRKSSIGIGAYYRYKDAIVPTVLLEIGQYGIGIAYDLNISGLTTASSLQGGPEIMLRFNSANPFLFQKHR
jgi:type IX secretion system PorP/SprF family membrane protein